MEYITLGSIKIEVELKDIKNLHLSVYPPNGYVRIAAPCKLDLDSIRIYALSKLDWIKKQQAKFIEQERETEREYLNRETHLFKGERYLLRISENNKTNSVNIEYDALVVYLKGEKEGKNIQTIIDLWYRQELKKTADTLIQKWEKIIGVKINDFSIRKMKTRWGSCDTKTGKIRLNIELIKKPVDCIEYIIVHEIIHLFERTHNQNFNAYMNKYLPQWKEIRAELNKLPLGTQVWKY